MPTFYRSNLNQVTRHSTIRHLRTALTILICLCTLQACGGGGGGGGNKTTSTPPPASEPPAPDIPNPNANSWALQVSDYLGSLYQVYDWSGPLRDPFRDEVELHPPTAFIPLTSSELSAIQTTLAQRDIIMQIGGMGSAKLDATNPDSINPQFADYMDSFIADGGVEWRDNVQSLAKQIATVVPTDRKLYWQIGNEINADSYTQNIQLYFGDNTIQTIPVYVEYFLAPTLQAFQAAATETGLPVDVALGSISNFSGTNSQQFLDDLLNYQIQGDYAPELTGKYVHELINLITIHYHMNAGTPDAPNSWRDVLTELYSKWVKDNIEGVWTTEEIGIQAVTDGYGAGASVRVLTRYLDWISTHTLNGHQAAFFFYGTTDGPDGQQVNDAMSNVLALTDDTHLYFYAQQLSQNDSVESYAYQVPVKTAWLLTSTALGEDTVTVSQIPINLPLTDPSSASVEAWLYTHNGTRQLLPLLNPNVDGVTVELNEQISLQKTDSLLIWVDE